VAYITQRRQERLLRVCVLFNLWDEILACATPQVSFEDVMMGDIKQTQKVVWHLKQSVPRQRGGPLPRGHRKQKWELLLSYEFRLEFGKMRTFCR
jgi:hypothetical protein